MGVRLRRSRLDSARTRRLLEHFVAGTTARTAAELVGVNRNTATSFYHRLRKLIAARLARSDDPDATDALMPDEIYLYGTGKLGIKQASSTGAPVFGLCLCRRKIRVMIVPNIQRDTLLQLLNEIHSRGASVYTVDAILSEALRSSGMRHHHIGGHNRFASTSNHVNRVENFWNQARRHLHKYNGVPHHHMHLYLKECEWRFNYGSPGQLLMTLRQWIREDL